MKLLFKILLCVTFMVAPLSARAEKVGGGDLTFTSALSIFLDRIAKALFLEMPSHLLRD